MRKKTNTITLVAIIVFAIGFVQCQKDEISKPDDLRAEIEQISLFTVSDDIVTFPNMQAFEQTIEELMSVSDLAFWEKDHGIMKSMRKMQDKNDTPINELIIPDDQFASLVNQDGLIIIGNEIHFITFEKEYTLPLELYLSEPSITIFRDSGKDFSIVRDIPSIDSNLKFGGWLEDYRDTNGDPLDGIRAKLSAWNVTYYYYASIGIRLKNYEDYGDLDKMKYGKVSGTAQWRLFPFTTWTYTYGEDEGTKTKKVDKTIAYLVGLSLVLQCESISATYKWEDDGPATGTATWNKTWN